MRVVVLRPEPGNAVTSARLEAYGLAVLRLPLFEVAPLAWQPPAPQRFDALLLTSANALRHGGPGLEALKALPVVAVGDATAQAAGHAGFSVAIVGTGDARHALEAAGAAGFSRLLHLAGREHVADLPVAATIIVYASEMVSPPAGALSTLAGKLVLLHSVRAAKRLASLVDDAGVAREAITLAALSPAVAAAAGGGWRGVEVADQPTDAALVALAGRITAGRDAHDRNGTRRPA